MQKLIKHYLLVFIIVFFILPINKVLAQPNTIQLNQLSTNEGLSSSWIISMEQDQNGFIWIGTSTGLNRYDGHDIKIYKTQKENPQSLADNLILALYLTESNNLYVGTNAGLSLYDPAFDGFINLSQDSSSCLYKLPLQVRNITGDNEGNLYLATNSGLIVYNAEENSIESYIHDPKNPESISASLVEDVMFDNSGKLWVATKKGLCIFYPDSKTFSRIAIDIKNENFSESRIYRIAQDNDGAIWFTSAEDGLFCLSKNNKLQQFKHHPNNPKSISAGRLLTLQVDAKNDLWIGAENDGVYLFNRESQDFSHYLNRESDPLSMKTYSVECIYMDNAENLWFGTYANGVNILPANGNAFISYDKFKGGDLSIANNLVNSFIEDEEGFIWIATDGGGLNLFNKKTSLFTSINKSNSEIPNDYITSLVEDKNRIIWMTSWGDGLIRYDYKKNKFRSFNTRNSKIHGDNIFCIIKGNNNDFWLGSFNEGLIHFEPEKNKFTSFNSENVHFDINYLRVLRAASNGVLYLGTSKGLYSFVPETGKFKELSLSEGNDETMSNLHVYDIFIENDTCLWVGTLMGLNRLNPETGENIKYTIKDGLPSNIISGIIKKKGGDLWISTTHGLCRFDSAKKEFNIFTKEDGLQSNEFRPKSIFEDSNGALYFGGFNGFDVIYPDKIVENTRIPQIQITGMDLFNEPVSPNTPGSPLKEIITNTKEIKLKYDQSVITFHFAALDFTRPQKNKFAYFLENFDKDWTYCGNRRDVTYTNLDPGKYIFHVKGSNNDGLWNNEGTSKVLIITPPWWKTIIFKIFLGLSLVVLILAIYYIRISSLQKQKLILEERVERRTNELATINATKDKLFSIIAHDLKTPFTAILGFTELLHNDFKSFDEKTIKMILADLREAGENTFILLKNLLDWSGMQRGTLDYNPVQTSAYEIVNNSIKMVSAISKKKNVVISNTIDNRIDPIFLDINMISLVFRNLLTNAVKFSNAGDQVIVDVLKESENSITFMVADTGVGIDPEKVKSLFTLSKSNSTLGTSGEKGTGLGLLLCFEFIEKHKGKIWVESELQKGSTFYFTLPKFETAVVEK